MNNEKLHYWERKLNRLKGQLLEIEHYSNKTHTYDGGWSRGYLEGRISVIENIVDDLKELGFV